VTGVGFGPSMFLAMAVPGVSVVTLDNLENYGLLTVISQPQHRKRGLNTYKHIYGLAIVTSPVMDFLVQTGLDVLKGADILNVAPGMYYSTVEYAETSIARKLKGIAQIHPANIGTRIFYCDHGSFDSHSNQLGMHETLRQEVFKAVQDFFDDLYEHDAADDVAMFLV